MKALVIKIKDAGIFKPPKISGSQDKVMDINGYISRYDKKKKTCAPFLKVPAGQLSFKHVANLLRVFFGERPVPTLRKVKEVFKGDPYFEDLAKKVRVKMDSPVLPIDPGHKETYYPEETLTVRKSVGDSWQTATRSYYLDGKYVQIKGGLLYPDRLRRGLGDDLYTQFNNLVGEFGFVGTTQEAIEFLNKHKTDAKVIDFCRICKKEGKTSFSNLILNENAVSITIHSRPQDLSYLNILMASGTVQIIEKFNATLYVPVTEEDLIKIDRGTGVASFLEGGFAFIDNVEDWSEILEIGTELTVEGAICI